MHWSYHPHLANGFSYFNPQSIIEFFWFYICIWKFLTCNNLNFSLLLLLLYQLVWLFIKHLLLSILFKIEFKSKCCRIDLIHFIDFKLIWYGNHFAPKNYDWFFQNGANNLWNYCCLGSFFLNWTCLDFLLFLSIVYV